MFNEEKVMLTRAYRAFKGRIVKRDNNSPHVEATNETPSLNTSVSVLGSRPDPELILNAAEKKSVTWSFSELFYFGSEEKLNKKYGPRIDKISKDMSELKAETEDLCQESAKQLEDAKKINAGFSDDLKRDKALMDALDKGVSPDKASEMLQENMQLRKERNSPKP